MRMKGKGFSCKIISNDKYSLKTVFDIAIQDDCIRKKSITITVTDNHPIFIPEPVPTERPGKKFTVWAKDETHQELWNFEDEPVPLGSTELFGEWEDIEDDDIPMAIPATGEARSPLHGFPLMCGALLLCVLLFRKARKTAC